MQQKWSVWGCSLRTLLIPALVLLVAGCRSEAARGDTFRGTAEVREIDVAPLAAGRLIDVRVDEGDIIEAGDTIALLHSPTVGPDSAAAVALFDAARARLHDLEAGSRPAEIARGEADLAARQADAERTARDRDRLRQLRDAGAVAPRDFEAAATAAEVAARAADAARESLALLKAGARSAQIAAARADADRAAAALRAQQALTHEYILTAPQSGVVLSRLAEPGDLLTVGAPVVRIGRVDEPWVRIFVPASLLPTLRIGDSVEIHPAGTDARSTPTDGPLIRGAIVAINPQAEYVTRPALSETERADLLFGVKVAIRDPEHRIKSGLPVQVYLPNKSGHE